MHERVHSASLLVPKRTPLSEVSNMIKAPRLLWFSRAKRVLDTDPLKMNES